MFCISCGTNLPDTARFCSSCGTPVTSPATGSESLAISQAPSHRDSLSLSENVREQIYNDLARATLDGIESGLIPFEEGQESAKSILRQLDSIHTYAELITFLRALAQKWQLYGSVLTKYSNH